jgi:hypothetical protein
MSEKTPKFRQCVSNKIRKIKDEKSGMKDDQIVVIALSECRKRFGIKRRAGDSVMWMWSSALGKLVDLNG